MNELERLSYLDALGISQWVSRAADMGITIHAKESEFSNLSDFQVQERTLEQINVEQNSVVKNSVEQAVAHSNFIEASLKQKAVSYAILQILQPQQYLIFAELQDASGKISPAEQQLLNNICNAINKSLNISNVHSAPELFKWPMFESKFSAAHLDQSERAAAESAQAFVSSRIEIKKIPLLILLGGQAIKLILDKETGSETQKSDYLKTSRFVNEKIIVSVSLQEMLENPESKGMLWRCLCVYFNEL